MGGIEDVKNLHLTKSNNPFQTYPCFVESFAYDLRNQQQAFLPKSVKVQKIEQKARTYMWKFGNFGTSNLNLLYFGSLNFRNCSPIDMLFSRKNRPTTIPTPRSRHECDIWNSLEWKSVDDPLSGRQSNSLLEFTNLYLPRSATSLHTFPTRLTHYFYLWRVNVTNQGSSFCQVLQQWFDLFFDPFSVANGR